MATLTTNLNLYKPAVNSPVDEGQWGSELNTNMDILDGAIPPKVDTTLTGTTTVDRVEFNGATIPTTQGFYKSGTFEVGYGINSAAHAFLGEAAFTYIGKDNNNFTATLSKPGTGTGAVGLNMLRNGSLVSAVSHDGTSYTFNNIVGDILTYRNSVLKQNIGSSATTFADPVIAPTTAKAWVKFTGSTGGILASQGVTSVVRNSQGIHTITVTTAFPDTNYTIIATAESNGGGYVVTNKLVGGTLTTTAVQVTSAQVTGGTGITDPPTVSVLFFR